MKDYELIFVNLGKNDEPIAQQNDMIDNLDLKQTQVGLKVAYHHEVWRQNNSLPAFK